jgi:hypothetical protein
LSVARSRRSRVRAASLLTGLATTAAVLLASGAAAQAASIWFPIDSGTTDTISAIVYQSPTRFWYATTNGRLAYFNGSAFVAGTGPSTGTNFTDLAFQPGTIGGPGTAGLYGYAVASDGSIWQTPDGGVSWAQLAKPNTYSNCSSSATLAPESELNAVVWAGSSTAYLLGDNSTLLKSTNAATSTPTFTEINKQNTGTCVAQSQPSGTERNLNDAVFLASNPLDGFMISQNFGDLYSTSNGFTSGTPLSELINNYTGDPRLAQDPANPNRIWAVDHQPGGAGCGSVCFALSTDGGVTFGHPTYPQYASTSTTPTLGLYDVSSQGGTEVAAGSAGEIFTSIDGTNFYNQPAAGALATEDWRAEDAFDAAHAAVGGVNGALVVSGLANTIPGTTPPTGAPQVSIGSGGSSNGTTVTVVVSCGTPPCRVTVTITVSVVSHAPRAVAARKKTKLVTLAKGTFKITKSGSNKLAVKLTKAGKKLLKQHHGHLKAKAHASTTVAGHVAKVSKTITITSKKKKK